MEASTARTAARPVLMAEHPASAPKCTPNPGVLLRLQEHQRVYWLPGVGCFSLLLAPGPNRPPLIGGPLGRLAPQPEPRIKPQARTRGLPRLRPPGAAS